MQTLFTICGLAYVAIYAFEGALRYGLHAIGTDNVILGRDLLVVVPVVVLLFYQALRTQLHPGFAVFGAIVLGHGLIGVLNFHTSVPLIYGAKLLLTVLFGFLAAQTLVSAPGWVAFTIGLLWVASVAGVVLDKFVFTFPWIGMETHIGGITVDVSRGWDISDSFERRAAGFTRSSISAAMLMPILALMVVSRFRSYLLRMVVLLITAGAVFLTTQKGSLLAISVVLLVLAAPRSMRYSLMSLAAVGCAAIAVLLPIFTQGLLMVQDGGVFSLSSFAMRITDTWPDAWRWIGLHDIFPFGTGLGGIGGAQRFYAPDSFNPADNVFIFLYANFGVLSFLYLGWMLRQGLRQPFETRSVALTPLAILTFSLGYGAALSMIEDQMSALFIGASVGMLWQLRQIATAGAWGDQFRGSPFWRVPTLEYQPHRALPAIAKSP